MLRNLRSGIFFGGKTKGKERGNTGKKGMIAGYVLRCLSDLLEGSIFIILPRASLFVGRVGRFKLYLFYMFTNTIA